MVELGGVEQRTHLPALRRSNYPFPSALPLLAPLFVALNHVQKCVTLRHSKARAPNEKVAIASCKLVLNGNAE